MSFPVKRFARSFSTSCARDGKRNFKNFVLYGRGTDQFRKQQEENPDKSLRITGRKTATYKLSRRLSVNVPIIISTGAILRFVERL